MQGERLYYVATTKGWRKVVVAPGENAVSVVCSEGYFLDIQKSVMFADFIRSMCEDRTLSPIYDKFSVFRLTKEDIKTLCQDQGYMVTDLGNVYPLPSPGEEVWLVPTNLGYHAILADSKDRAVQVAGQLHGVTFTKDSQVVSAEALKAAVKKYGCRESSMLTWIGASLGYTSKMTAEQYDTIVSMLKAIGYTVKTSHHHVHKNQSFAEFYGVAPYSGLQNQSFAELYGAKGLRDCNYTQSPPADLDARPAEVRRDLILEAITASKEKLAEEEKIKEKIRNNVFTEPQVELVAQTVVDDKTVDQWLAARGMEFTTNAAAEVDALTEFAGRVCYLSFNQKLRKPTDDQNRDYVRDNVVKKHHGSIAEHASWSFIINHVSRNMTHELVRHRVGVGYSQTSTRYVDQFNDKYFIEGQGNCVGLYMPPEVFRDPEMYQDWIALYGNVLSVYTRTFEGLRKKLGLETKAARSIARHCLPGAAGTYILFTVNARELDHIFRMRGSLFADDEIRRMTIQIFKLVGECNVFSHWSIAVDPVSKREFLSENVESKLSFSRVPDDLVPTGGSDLVGSVERESVPTPGLLSSVCNGAPGSVAKI